MFRSMYFSLCCSVYLFFCVNMNCTAVIGCQPNCSKQIYHIISYQNYRWLASNFKIIYLVRVLLQFEASSVKGVYCAVGI